MNKQKQTPEFYWGAATASYQVEGYNENTDWAKAAKEGKVPPAGRLADHYHLYEADFDLVKELGHNAHRFSIEWARIEPREGVFDETEIAHYMDVLRALRARNIEPFVTLWHFTLPLWFSESGGFERKDAPEIFARYCAKVTESFGDLVIHYATTNESIVFANNGWLRGQWPPFKRWSLFSFVKVANSGADESAARSKGIKSLLTFLRVRDTLAKAHIAAYRQIKSINPNTDVSIIRDVIVFDANWNPIYKLVAVLMNWFWTHRFNRKIKGNFDSFGLNYYFYKKFGDKTNYKKTDMNWDFVPERLDKAIAILAQYKKPIFIAEVGIADECDVQRAEYISKSVEAVNRMREQGVEITGFMYWSLMDNYEWALGIGKRFGLIEIDYATLKRKIRPSAYVYKKIIENKGVVE